MKMLSNRRYLAAIVAMLALALACALPAGFAFGDTPDEGPDQGGLAQTGDEGGDIGEAVGVEADADDAADPDNAANDATDPDAAIGQDASSGPDAGTDPDSNANSDSDVVPAAPAAVTDPASPPVDEEVAPTTDPVAVEQPEAEAAPVAEAAPAATVALTTQATATKASKKKYTVRFYDAFGNLVKTQKVTAGKNAKAPKLAAMANRTFKGWSVSFKKVKSNLRVYAIYKDKKNNYYLTFDMSSIKGSYDKMQTISIKGGTKYVLSPRYSTKDRFLVGYTTLPNGKGTFYTSPSVVTMPKRDMVLYPKFAKKASTVVLTLKTGRSQSSSTSLRKKGEKVTVGDPSLRTNAGFTLVGYSTKANGKGKFYALGSTYTMPKRNATLHGVWKKNTTCLRIIANRAKGVSVDYYVPAGYALPIRPSSNQMTGDGEGFADVYLKALTTKKNGKGTKYAMTYGKVTASTVAPSYIKVPKKGLTLYAQWAKYKKLKVNGNYSGASTETQTYQSGFNASVNSYYYRTGYQLVGFSTKKNGGGAFYTPGCTFRIAKNVTLYAQWKKYNAAIKLNENYSGGGTYTTQIVGGRPTQTDGWAYREGYQIASWNTKKDGTGASYLPGALLTVPTGKTKTLYARWTKLAQVTYNSNYEGGYTRTTSVVPGALVTGGSMTRDDYAIVGWNTKANGTGKKYGVFESVKVPKKGMTLYAMWKKNNVTVTFNLNGGSYNGSTSAVKMQAVKGQAISGYSTVPYAYRDGYVQVGWNTRKDGKGTSYVNGDLYAYNSTYASLFKAKNMTLYAQWQKAPKLTYVANNGTSDKYAQTLTGGTRLGNPRGYTKSGKVLVSWNTKADGKGKVFALGAYLASAPASGLKVYGQWKKPTAKITLNGNGKAANTTIGVRGNAYNYVTDVWDPTSTDQTFYFKGWNTKANGKGDSVYMGYSTVYVPTAGKTVYAIWGKKAKVSFDANGGEGYLPDEYVNPGYGVDLYQASSAVTRAGFTLIGWSTDPYATYAEYSEYGYYYTDDVDGSTAMLYAVWQQDEPGSGGDPGNG